MKLSSIRLVVILGAIAIIGIMVAQIYWVKQAFDIQTREFDQQVYVSLNRVAEKMADYNGTTMPISSPVNQMSSDYFVVNVNDFIDANTLEHFLKEEFERESVFADYEYYIYDCSNDDMVFAGQVSSGTDAETDEVVTDLPKLDEFAYYFGVRFPDLPVYLANQMELWIASSIVSIIAVLVFSYALFIILKQKRLSEVQRDFINNMTHEFKTPISTIAISADVLSKPNIIEKPDRLLNYATIIKEENTRLQNQVEKVLQMAQTEKREFELNLEPINLNELVEKVAQTFSLNIKEKQGNLKCYLGKDLPPIEADSLHLTNLVYNLLDNAVKYNSSTPEVNITTEMKDGQLLLSVKDNGIGIDPSHQKKIFDKFFRVPTGNVHNVKGFGIGLNYVSNIVKAHSWRINLESETGKGSLFTVSIPTN